MKWGLRLLSSNIHRNPMLAFVFLLIAIAALILLLWGMAIAGDLVLQTFRNRVGARTKLFLVCATSVVAAVVAARLSKASSDHDDNRSKFVLPDLVIGLATLAISAALLSLLSQWDKLDSALQETAQDFFRFAFWPTLIAFSLLWTVRAVAHDFGRLLAGPGRLNIALRSARGLIGACACAATATWIAVRHGAELNQLYAPRIFYIVVVPAVAGFGWTAAWSTTPSRMFIVAFMFIALAMAVFTVLRPSSRDNEIECQYWYPTGVHNVFGFRTDFRYEPWTWRLDTAFDILFLPGALGELTVSYIREPLTALRC